MRKPKTIKFKKLKKPKFRGCSLDQFKRHCLKNNGIGYMYIIRLDGDGESFIKVGISSNIENRFKSIPYSCTVLKLISGSATSIYVREQQVHKMLKEQRYIPQKRFGGKYECYPLSSCALLGVSERNQF